MLTFSHSHRCILISSASIDGRKFSIEEKIVPRVTPRATKHLLLILVHTTIMEYFLGFSQFLGSSNCWFLFWKCSIVLIFCLQGWPNSLQVWGRCCSVPFISATYHRLDVDYNGREFKYCFACQYARWSEGGWKAIW